MVNKRLISVVTVVAITCSIFSGSLTTYAADDLNGTTTGIEGSAEAIGGKTIIVSDFKLDEYENYSEYNQLFRLETEDIKSITNNGGQYSSSSINKAIDMNTSTHWETGTQNSSIFKNEVIVTFKEEQNIDRLAFLARQSGDKGKGFPISMSIYASTTEEGDNFALVGSYKDAKVNTDVIELKFNATTAKRVKLVFDEAYQNWASIAELSFYKTDTLLQIPEKLFTDGTMSSLRDEYKSKEAIDNLNKEVQNHPFSKIYESLIKVAYDILDGTLITEGRILTLSQRGNTGTEQVRTQTAYGLYAFDPTGYYVTPGEKITVYVEADPKGTMPQLVLGQIADDKNGWSRFYTLKPGINVIETQGFDKMAPAAIYFNANALSTDQAYAPTVRFVGGTKFPMYVHGKTEPKAFVEELKAYLKEVNYSDKEVAAGNGKYNISEVVSENVIISTSAAGALKGIEEEMVSTGKTIGDTMNLYEILYDDFAKWSGYELVNEVDPDYRPRGKFMLRVFTKGPYGWGDWGYTGYNGGNSEKRNEGWWDQLVKATSLTSAGWAIPHEIGHTMDNGTLTTQESTNNLYSLLMQDKYLDSNRMVDENRWENQFTEYHNNHSSQNVNDYFFFMAVPYQLFAEFGDTLYGDSQKIARTRRSELSGLNNKQRLAVCMSLATGYNLLYHFEYYGFPMNDKAKSLVANLPEYGKKTYYINDKSFEENAKAFEDKNIKPTIQAINDLNKNISLTMSIGEDSNSLLVYELYKDGEFLGVTYGSNFIDKNANDGLTHEYSVIAYDRKLNPSQISDVVSKNAQDPIIKGVNDLVLALNEEFNITDYVSATDYEGNDISSKLEIIENNIDTTKKGNYKATLKVESKGLAAEKTINVKVVSDYEYLSNMKYVSASVGYGSLKLDKDIENDAIELLTNGQIITFNKGIGAHANSEIIYDLTGKGYEYFEAYAGIDSDKGGNGSVIFKVYVDGQLIDESNILKGNSEAKHFSINVAGASELKLVADSNGDNSHDHAVWGDAKFLTNNSIPELTIPKSVSTKVGEDIDLNDTYIATDVEDGDISSKVIITGIDNVDFNKSGEYEITYTVTDSDGNTVIKSRTIAVVDMLDSAYLGDFDWTSTSNSYTAPVKNNSISGKGLRLTDDNGSVISYEKGIGAHSNSTIVYDLKDKNYDYFTSYVGVDRQMYGTIASITFEVYVDGEKKFDSGLMNSRDAMKYIEVDINGAKELKLVVTDGGNGNGSDHGAWGDTKLHYANSERPYYDELNKVLAVAKEIDTIIYTEESVIALNTVISKVESAIKANSYTRTEINALVEEVNNTINNLKLARELTEVITIADKYLAKDIRVELGLANGVDITVGDIYKLTKLTCDSGRVTSLEGLQNAINLNTLIIAGNGVYDFSPLKNLTKLTTLNANNQIAYMETLKTTNGIVEFNNVVTDKNGNKVIPSLINLRSNSNATSINLDINNVLVDNKYTLDLSENDKSYYTLSIKYKVDGNDVYQMYIVNNK